MVVQVNNQKPQRPRGNSTMRNCWWFQSKNGSVVCSNTCNFTHGETMIESWPILPDRVNQTVYPLVNVNITIERSTICKKIHYSMAMFNSKLMTNYQSLRRTRILLQDVASLPFDQVAIHQIQEPALTEEAAGREVTLWLPSGNLSIVCYLKWPQE